MSDVLIHFFTQKFQFKIFKDENSEIFLNNSKVENFGEIPNCNQLTMISNSHDEYDFVK